MFRCNTTYLKEYADEQKRVRNYVRDGQTYNCWDDFDELKAYGNDQCCRIGGFYEDFSTADASVKYDAFKDTVDTIVGSTQLEPLEWSGCLAVSAGLYMEEISGCNVYQPNILYDQTPHYQLDKFSTYASHR